MTLDVKAVWEKIYKAQTDYKSIQEEYNRILNAINSAEGDRYTALSDDLEKCIHEMSRSRMINVPEIWQHFVDFEVAKGFLQGMHYVVTNAETPKLYIWKDMSVGDLGFGFAFAVAPNVEDAIAAITDKSDSEHFKKLLEKLDPIVFEESKGFFVSGDFKYDF